MSAHPSPTIIRRRLQLWFTRHRRDLPWRQTHDPYKILISEVMLQQTQVDRVIPKYLAWLKKFPTVEALARAPLSEVLKLWSGLGYNSRAIRLRELARVVVQQHGGKFPADIEMLESLPGIGPYTARAIASFAFQQDIGVIDTNVRRVIGRIFFGLKTPAPKKLEALVHDIVPSGESEHWNAALMDFGALVCQSQRPKCETCPVQKYCRAYPAVLQPKKRIKKARQPFRETDRYWRGRIVALLVHDGSATATVLREKLGYLGSLPVVRFQKLVRQLQQEGLLSRQGGKLSIQA